MLPLDSVLLGPISAGATRLDRALERALDAPVLDGASFGVLVWDQGGGERFSWDADRRLIPASTTKWITAAAAAERLGLEHRFLTRLAMTGTLTGGVLSGDLVLVGGGDPSLGVEDPSRTLGEIVGFVQAAGITRIEGEIVVDTSAFDGPPYGPGWMWDDFQSPYSPPYGAVNFAHNLLAEGLPCEAHDGIGSPLKDPPRCLADSLRAALVGAQIEAGAASVRPAPDALDLAVLPSPPLRDLLRKMLVDSDNLYAECIARALDRAPPADADEAGLALAELLRKAGVSEGSARFVDGSGLSRYSFASAEAMVRISAWVSGQPFGTELFSLLPVAGREGTLARRMLGTPAEGHCAAKTGSMTGVRNIVGAVDTATGERLWFAILINGFAAPQAEAIAVQDRFVAMIAASDGRKIPRRTMLEYLNP